MTRPPSPSRLLFAALAVLLLAVAVAAGGDETPAAAPVELGAIAWGRRWDEASATARSAGKPLLVLFQEVPG